jgi:hypothetical protein
VIPISYMGLVSRKPAPLEKVVNKAEKHIIHKAIEWKGMLDDGIVGSLSELARGKGISRTRVTQILNLLKLPSEIKENLANQTNQKFIRFFTERRLREIATIRHPGGQIRKFQEMEDMALER